MVGLGVYNGIQIDYPESVPEAFATLAYDTIRFTIEGKVVDSSGRGDNRAQDQQSDDPTSPHRLCLKHRAHVMAGLASISAYGERSMSVSEAMIVVGRVYEGLSLDTEEAKVMAGEIVQYLANHCTEGKDQARDMQLVALRTAVAQLNEGENEIADQLRKRFNGCKRWRNHASQRITGTFVPLGPLALAEERARAVGWVRTSSGVDPAVGYGSGHGTATDAEILTPRRNVNVD